MTRGILIAAAWVLAGCDPTAGSGAAGTIHLRLAAPLGTELAGVQFQLNCGGAVTESFVPFEAEGLPEHVDAGHAGASFADLFQVVGAGDCTVSAVAMATPDTAEPGCTPAEASLVVQAGFTTETVLTILCDSSGATDVVVVVDEAPSVTGWAVTTTEAPTCTELAARVESEDPEGAELSYEFVVQGPTDDAVFDVQIDPLDTVRLVAETPGDYTITAVVSDGLQSTTDTLVLAVVPGEEGCLSP